MTRRQFSASLDKKRQRKERKDETLAHLCLVIIRCRHDPAQKLHFLTLDIMDTSQICVLASSTNIVEPPERLEVLWSDEVAGDEETKCEAQTCPANEVKIISLFFLDD